MVQNPTLHKNNMQYEGRRAGMVISPSSTDFVAQCYELNEAPGLGSLVRCDAAQPTYGIVVEAYTENADQTRPNLPKGSERITLRSYI